MASGDIVGHILRIMPPAANSAALTQRAGGSTPAERYLVCAFDAAAIEYMDYLITLRGYDGGGLTVELPWTAASATSGDTIWGAAIRRIQASTEDVDTSQTYDFNDASASTAPGTNGQLVVPTVAFTDGADMDSLANNEYGILRVRRNATAGGDGMTGDAELWTPLIRET